MTLERIAGAVKERLLSIVAYSREQRRYVVGAREACASIAEDCGPRICKEKALLSRAVRGLRIFTETLYSLEPVEAVALLKTQIPDAPPTLTIEIFTDIRFEEDEASRQFAEAITQAKTEFASHLDPIIPSGLRFVSARKDILDIVEKKVRKRWTEDPTVELQIFAIFQRNL